MEQFWFLVSCAFPFSSSAWRQHDLPNNLFMPESLHPLLQELLNNNARLAAAAVAVIALVMPLFMLRPRLQNWRQERHIRKALRRLGVRSMENIHLPDGTGGEVTIDHLLLGRDAILVVGVMRFEGLIFGSPRTDQWTQVINRKSYKFDNPDQHLQRQINAVRLVVPDARVSGWHLFGYGAKFPKDKPDSVLRLADVRSLPKRPRRRDIPKPLHAAWKQLVDTVSG